MIKFYRDERRRARVDVNGLHPLISSFLEQDLQESSRLCRQMIDIIDEFKEGNQSEQSSTGNAHTVTLRPDFVVIHNEWDDSFGDAVLSTDLFRSCIEAWEAFISSPNPKG